MNSALTNKLLGHLHRIFDKDPGRELALRIRYPGTMTWRIRDGILSTVVDPQTVTARPLYLDGTWRLDGTQDLDGGDGFATSNLNIDLSQYTIAELADYIAALGGYSIVYESGNYGSLSALVLLDGEGNQDESNGDHFYAYTSLLWSYVSSLSAELADAALAIIEMLKQMSLRTAEGFWLDELGSYYKVPRILGESDGAYGPRIVAETLRPKGNNFAIAAAIKEASGVDASVVDSALLPVETNFFDGSWNFDGSRLYAVHDITSTYGLFDVLVEYDILGDANVTSYIQAVSEQVNRLRDAGTYMRQIGISGSSEIVDTYTAPITDSCEITITEVWHYDGSVRFDGSALFGSRIISTESI